MDRRTVAAHPHCTTASVAMMEVAEAALVAGRGIEGDRYFLGTGTYSRSAKPDVREVTLFEMEVLEALLRNDPPLQSGPITIAPADHRRSRWWGSPSIASLESASESVMSFSLADVSISPANILRSYSACRSIFRSTIDQALIARLKRGV
jgi:hypothetical protein